jgi:hypothetical protein
VNDIISAESTALKFISRWERSGGAERANYQSFLNELAELLGVSRPEPAKSDPLENAYVFDHPVPIQSKTGMTTGYIDLYKRGSFVLETKQGVDKQTAVDSPVKSSKQLRKGHGTRGTRGWDEAMYKAKLQAEGYARGVPATDGRPPFLVVVDIGHCIELYSEFSRTGGIYQQFPDAQSYRIPLRDLANEDVQQRLRLVWNDPLSLDPSRYSAKVTRKLAAQLAELAKSLEDSGHEAKNVAAFLMRCLFTFFAEDIKLLPAGGFTIMLQGLKDEAAFVPMTVQLWKTMHDGGYSSMFQEKLLRFNGGLFSDAEALPLTKPQLELLISAGKANWQHVEPAIFGTLLERALSATERHKLGAHYTPRAYVERLVLPTVIEPLRADWKAVQAKAASYIERDQSAAAVKLVKKFHHKLCTLKVLDPACGSGNFLYVTFEHLKRLEGEVLTFQHDLGEHQTLLSLEGTTVDPHQLLGIELNPRAAVIADMVLWIGYLQWHFRTHGNVMPPEPVIRKFHNIECRDAVLVWDRIDLVTVDKDKPVTRWDGVKYKKHGITGENVPDETATIPVCRYVNPRPTDWPKADFIVGNPPYIGVRRLRTSIGDEYVEALTGAYPLVPETCDYVMYWWEKAANAVASGATRRFGFITTNSIVQTYSRRLLDRHLIDGGKVHLAFAISDHPWVDAADGAAVRVAMTVGAAAKSGEKVLLGTVAGNDESASVTFREVERIGTSLNAVSVHETIEPLEANRSMCFQGVVPAGDGFKLDTADLDRLGYTANALPPVIRPYIIGKDLVQKPETRYIIDFFGLTADEAKASYPSLYQRLFDRVKPERDQNNRLAYKERWWLFAETRPAMRNALSGLSRYIGTPYTAKFRPFVFVPADTLPDAMVYAIPSDDAYLLGVLSTRIHSTWALSAGGHLGVGNDPRYTSKGTFFPFPFPVCDDGTKATIRNHANKLDTHRKTQQVAHTGLTLTDMYNVLEKQRTGTSLTDKERTIHEKGVLTVLKQHHDDLDSAVCAAYGWPTTLTDEELLRNLISLNQARRADEKQGHIRWLRPELQNPAKTAEFIEVEMMSELEETRLPEKASLPKDHTEQLQAIRAVLSALNGPVSAEEVTKGFINARPRKVQKLLDDLVTLGLANNAAEGRYTI